MVKNKERYENVEIVQMLPLKSMPYVEEGMEGHFKYNTLFVGNATRKAVAEGGTAYPLCYFYQIPKLFETTLPVDVALIHVTAIDILWSIKKTH